MLKKVNKNTVATQVINQLTELIRSGELRPGGRLPSEREMAEQLGVSRPPLREALRALEYAGIIETRYGDGIYVKSTDFPTEANPLFSNILNQYSLEEMIEMRQIVEKAAIELAVERATEEDMDAIRAIQAESKRALNNTENFVECDFAFHSAVAEAARNSMLFKTVKTMRKMMAEFNRDLLDSRTFRANVLRQHQAILDALEGRNSVEAVAAMDKHLDNVVSQSLLKRSKDGVSRPVSVRMSLSAHEQPV